MPHQVINIPFGDQLIGQGYNSNTGEAIGTALDVGMIKEDPTVDGGKAVTTFELVATQDSLLETLGISASVDLRIGLFSGGAKMSFAEDHAVNSFSTYVVGRSSIQNAVRHGIGFRLTAPAQALVDAGRMPEFKQAFGDRFVRSFLTGGEFCVVARITSVSEEHQSALAASLHGAYNGLTASGDFSAAFNKALSETHGRTDVSVKMFQSGAKGLSWPLQGRTPSTSSIA